MGKIKLRIEFLDMAREFFSSLPEKVQQKITYNFLKIEGGEINKDIFKKLEDTEIWEFRTLFNGTCYRFFAFWDTELEALVGCHTRNSEKDTENAEKRNKKGRSHKKGIF